MPVIFESNSLDWFEKQQLQQQQQQQPINFQQPSIGFPFAWSESPFFSNIKSFASFENILQPRQANETITTNDEYESGDVLQGRDFKENEHQGLKVDGTTVLPITITVFSLAILLMLTYIGIRQYRKRKERILEEIEDLESSSSSGSSLKSKSSSFTDSKPQPPVLDKYTTAPTKITNLRQMQQNQKQQVMNPPKIHNNGMRQWIPGNSPILPPTKPWMMHAPISSKKNFVSPKSSSPYPIKDDALPAIPPDAHVSPPVSYYSTPNIARQSRISRSSRRLK